MCSFTYEKNNGHVLLTGEENMTVCIQTVYAQSSTFPVVSE